MIKVNESFPIDFTKGRIGPPNYIWNWFLQSVYLSLLIKLLALESEMIIF